jgi:hypothetical protein
MLKASLVTCQIPTLALSEVARGRLGQVTRQADGQEQQTQQQTDSECMNDGPDSESLILREIG